MKRVTLYNAKELLQDDIVKISPVWWSGRDRRFFLLRWLFPRREFFKVLSDIKVQLSTGKNTTIPKGYKTDLSSSPRIFWSIVPPYGPFLLAALIHDWLYVTQDVVDNQKEADKEMLVWSNVINENRRDNKVRYYAVRLFGWTWWRKSAKRIAKEKNKL
jgi:hypothetical protein